MRHFILIFVFCLSFSKGINAQTPKAHSASDIYHEIQKLNFLGTALYIAAHPDDENTRLISYLSNHEHARTGYLSMTRGDGGQNLIGPELRELLGVLRTQELLAARRVDGGEQMFTRAVDFGYSKNPKETLEIWDKELILGDVVTAIRKFKPDVIINRFDHRSPGSTHGHHTSSAMLSVEAFDLANDPKAFPDHLDNLDLWQPKRLFFNTSWWFYGSQEKFEEADKTNLLNVDIGTYYPMLGMSNNEIASLASSQHLCQGFGRLSSRGSEEEYLELLKGDLPKNKGNLFEGINTTWTRIKGGKEIGDILNKVEANFNFNNPSEHLEDLVEAYQLLQRVEDEHWKTLKTEALKAIIEEVAGLRLEAFTKIPYSNPGEDLTVFIEAINRSDKNITLGPVSILGNDHAIQNSSSVALKNNVLLTSEIKISLPNTLNFTSPYWLLEQGALGTYTVNESQLIGKPETPRSLSATFNLMYNGVKIPITKDIKYKYGRPDKGEIYQPFEIVPKATSQLQDKVIIFSNGNSQQIPVTIKAHKDNVQGKLTLKVGSNWILDTPSQSFNIEKKGDEQTLVFNLTPPKFENEDYLIPIVEVDGEKNSKELVSIAYDHIPTQTVLMPSEAKVVRLDIIKSGQHIGYIMGAGDDVPTSLEQIGYTVHTINPSDINENSLQKYDAVVLGIRAYNVVNELSFKQKYILDYAKQGGTVIVQYNTAGRWANQFENIAPYHLEISRDRVTNENSEVKIIAQDNDLVNYPNKITEDDFKGWVQERGLYFPDKWSKEFTPVLEMKDEGENATKGSLLVAPYGEGYYIYTGLSFFRELPAGVPGAYKLFSNMLSIGKGNLAQKEEIKG